MTGQRLSNKSFNFCTIQIHYENCKQQQINLNQNQVGEIFKLKLDLLIIISVFNCHTSKQTKGQWNPKTQYPRAIYRKHRIEWPQVIDCQRNCIFLYYKRNQNRHTKREKKILKEYQCLNMQSTRVCVKVTSSISVTPIQSSYVPFRRDIRFYSSLNRINRVYTSLSHLTGLERCDILYWMDFSYLEMEFLF